ncbi:Uncharacterised protein [Streptococcus pneumoniae]|nr:Uncharacterised protein [Streptococcus pneumoniae]
MNRYAVQLISRGAINKMGLFVNCSGLKKS